MAKSESPAEDEAVERVSSPSHHLLWHSDCEGYYLPVDFPEVIEGQDIPAGAVGSSQRLFREFIQVAPALGINLTDSVLSDAEAQRLTSLIEAQADYFNEIMVWLALFEASRLSIEHKAAIYFG